MDPKDLLGTVLGLAGYHELADDIDVAKKFLRKKAEWAVDTVDRMVDHLGAPVMRIAHLFNLLVFSVLCAASIVWFAIYSPSWLKIAIPAELVVLLPTVFYAVRLTGVHPIRMGLYLDSLDFIERRAQVQRENARIAQANGLPNAVQQPLLPLPTPPTGLLTQARMRELFGPDGRFTVMSVLTWFLTHLAFYGIIIVIGGSMGYLDGVGWMAGLLLVLMALPSVLLVMGGRAVVIKALRYLTSTFDELAGAILNNTVIRLFLLWLPGITSENISKAMPKDVAIPTEGIVTGVDAEVFDPFLQGIVLLWASNVWILDIRWATIIFGTTLVVSTLLEWVQKKTQIETLPKRQRNLKVTTAIIMAGLIITRALWEGLHAEDVVPVANNGIGWLNSFMAMSWWKGIGAIFLLMFLAWTVMPDEKQQKNEPKPVLQIRYAAGGVFGLVMFAIVISWLGSMAGHPTTLSPITPHDSLARPVVAGESATPPNDTATIGPDRVDTSRTVRPISVPAPTPREHHAQTHVSRSSEHPSVASCDEACQCRLAAHRPDLLARARRVGLCL